jgi:hypothetical protein
MPVLPAPHRPLPAPCVQGSIKLGFPLDPVHSRKSQNQFPHLGSLDLGLDSHCPIVRKVPAEHMSYVEKQAAPADYASIMGAVADDVTFGTPHGILERNRVDRWVVSATINRI